MKRISQNVLLVGFLLCTLSGLKAQISGMISDADGFPLIGVSIVEDGTSNGTITDIDGTFSFTPSGYPATLIYSYVGYVEQSVTYDGPTSGVNLMLSEGVALDDVVVVGTRTAPRSSTTTPLPVDVFKASDLTSTGQVTFDKALQYKVPSFNTVQTPVNDATSLLDPYEIRNMGPSRTLILVNGKRKNMSALLYTQTSPGRGETGADISSIPTDMIKRVEILRDGASAQYGSDAIAGVMNVILKDSDDDGRITVRTGITGKGDGEMLGVALNNGSSFGENGFVNYTIDMSKTLLANRPGTVDAEGEAGDFGADINDVKKFLELKPDAGNINGSPATTALKFALNAEREIGDGAALYGNAAYVYKKVNSFANYRTPYWRTEAAFPYLKDFFPDGPNGTYVGYVPTFDGNLIDYNATVGLTKTINGWNSDVSFTTGSNTQTYRVTNSHNRSDVKNPDGTNKYREFSQLSFDPGGTKFDHIVGNLDINKRFTDMFSIGVGAEFRTENFTIIPGEVASYEGGGPDSFSGNDPRNSGKFNRYNMGGYVDMAFDLTDDFLINGTYRMENYSDFGNANVWKISSRYKFAEDMVTLRASASSGFKAPTLHQIYTQKAQYSFVPGKGIQVGGLVNNVSTQARLLGIPSLKPEKSTNITIGLGLKPSSNFSVTLDYYNIALKDRIILSTEIGKTDEGNSTLDKILDENNLSDLSFFVNGLNTRTSGIDFVANYRGVVIGPGTLNTSLSGNYVIQNERDGDVLNPSIVSEAGQSVANQTQEALFFTSRPKFKAILGLDYSIGKLNVSLGNTLFGPTKFYQQGLAPGIYTEFKPKVVTDLGVSYDVNEKLNIAINANNVLDVLPEWEFKTDTDAGAQALSGNEKKFSNLITFNQRYSQMTYDGYHFSQLGSMFNASISYKF